jgi:hypothetical protein
MFEASFSPTPLINKSTMITSISYIRLLVKLYVLAVMLAPVVDYPYCYSCDHELDIEDTFNSRTCKYCDGLIYYKGGCE